MISNIPDDMIDNYMTEHLTGQPVFRSVMTADEYGRSIAVSVHSAICEQGPAAESLLVADAIGMTLLSLIDRAKDRKARRRLKRAERSVTSAMRVLSTEVLGKPAFNLRAFVSDISWSMCLNIAAVAFALAFIIDTMSNTQ